MMRAIVAAGLLLGAIASAEAETTLRVGDQKGNSQAVMEAAGVLKDVPYKIEWGDHRRRAVAMAFCIVAD